MKKITILFMLLGLLAMSLVPTFAQVATVDLVDHLDNYLQNELPEGWGTVRSDALFTELIESPPFLLDVREVAELEAGYLEGAVNIPLREIGENLDLLPGLDDPIVVYCKGGHRGAIAMTSLQVLGYTNVRNLAGGFDGWAGQDYPVVMDEMPEPVAGEMPDIDPALVETVSSYLASVPQGFGSVSAEAVFTELVESPPFLVDVREIGEWESNGYIEGAINVPLRTVAASLDQLPEDLNAPIVVYCAAGHRGAIGMTVLQMLGYTNVRNMAGGFGGWLSAGYPTVGGTEAAVDTSPPEGEILAAEALAPVAYDYLANIPSGFSSVAADAFNEQMADSFVLDVRELDEYEGGHIEGAVNIPVREVVQNLNLIPMDQPILVYCAAGTRGALATTALEMLGYNAVNLRGGIRAWTGAGYPVTEESTPEVAPGAFPEVDADLWTTLNEYMANLPAGFSGIGVDDFNLSLVEGDAPFILDVREASEFAGGHLAGAVNIPLREIGDNTDALPATDMPILVYDSSSQRSVQAMFVLQILGFENVQNLNGGFAAWQAAGYEVVTE